MAIKMRILHATKKAKLIAMAGILNDEFKLTANAVDCIPPAYSCDRERLLILIMTLKGDLDNKVRLFCRELSKERAQNTALICDGSEDAAKKLLELLKEAGTNVIDNVHFVKGGIPFLKGVSSDEKAALINWVNAVIESL